MSATLYLDESKARGYVIVAAAVVPGEAATTRRALHDLRLRGQRRIHFVHESDARRREILSAMVALGLRTHVYYATGLSDARARERVLDRIVADVDSLDVTRIVLERDDSIVQADRRILRAALEDLDLRDRVSYGHERAQDEPLLWIADAVAWSYGRGGDWRRRASSLIVDTHRVGR